MRTHTPFHTTARPPDEHAALLDELHDCVARRELAGFVFGGAVRDIAYGVTPHDYDVACASQAGRSLTQEDGFRRVEEAAQEFAKRLGGGEVQVIARDRTVRIDLANAADWDLPHVDLAWHGVRYDGSATRMPEQFASMGNEFTVDGAARPLPWGPVWSCYATWEQDARERVLRPGRIVSWSMLTPLAARAILKACHLWVQHGMWFESTESENEFRAVARFLIELAFAERQTPDSQYARRSIVSRLHREFEEPASMCAQVWLSACRQFDVDVLLFGRGDCGRRSSVERLLELGDSATVFARLAAVLKCYGISADEWTRRAVYSDEQRRALLIEAGD